jgi:hypothetical protein
LIGAPWHVYIVHDAGLYLNYTRKLGGGPAHIYNIFNNSSYTAE